MIYLIDTPLLKRLSSASPSPKTRYNTNFSIFGFFLGLWPTFSLYRKSVIISTLMSLLILILMYLNLSLKETTEHRHGFLRGPAIARARADRQTL